MIYPEKWSRITDFVYVTDLHLKRTTRALQTRKGRDADYYLAHPYVVRVYVDGEPMTIEAPAGMATDLSSVPRWAWSLTGIGRVGPHLEASIIHDWLYIAWQGQTEPTEDNRKFADEVFLKGMEAAKVPWIRRRLIYSAVRIGGRAAFFT